MPRPDGSAVATLGLCCRRIYPVCMPLVIDLVSLGCGSLTGRFCDILLVLVGCPHCCDKIHFSSERSSHNAPSVSRHVPGFCLLTLVGVLYTQWISFHHTTLLLLVVRVPSAGIPLQTRYFQCRPLSLSGSELLKSCHKGSRYRV